MACRRTDAVHYKRRRPRNRRAGCLLCKPHKANGQKGRVASLRLPERRLLISDREQFSSLRNEGTMSGGTAG